MPSSTGAKAALRAQVRARAAALLPQARRESDRALAERFLSLSQVKEAEGLLLFHGVGSEPDTRPILEALWAQGKTLFLPKCRPGGRLSPRRVERWEELVPGAFHIPEPGEGCPEAEEGEIQLALVPALCYSPSRFRLGQGGGYYDRYLAEFSGLAVGLCRDGLLLPDLPTEPHDRRVDLLLTETAGFSR